MRCACQATTGVTLAGKTLRLLGLGRVGKRMAEYAKAFGMEVIAWSQNLTAAAGARRVEKAALIEVLGTGRIAGAGLDGFDIEPLPPDHPLRLLPSVTLSPHLGYVTREMLASSTRTPWKPWRPGWTAHPFGSPIQQRCGADPQAISPGSKSILRR